MLSRHAIYERVWRQWLKQPYILHAAGYGQGDEPLVLLHGLASSHQVWQPLVTIARKDWRIITPDLLGFGVSPSPDWAMYDAAQHAAHVRKLLRVRKIRGPLTIVAHSMGCLVAVHLAYTHPGLVKRLILFEPPLFADVPEHKAHQRLRRRYFELFRYIADRPQLIFKDGALRDIWKKLAGVDLRPLHWIAFQRSLRNTIMNQTTYDELHTIAVPTTIVHGRLDIVVPRADVRTMLRANPNIDFHTVNRVHGLSQSAASELYKILTKQKTRS